MNNIQKSHDYKTDVFHLLNDVKKYIAIGA